MNDLSASATPTAAREFREALKYLGDSFVSCANTFSDVRALLLVNDLGQHGVAPGIMPGKDNGWAELVNFDDGAGARPVLRRLCLQGSAGWRERIRAGVVVANGPPPMDWKDDKAVFYPESDWPRPWGWFTQDDAQLETFMVWQVGSDAGWARFLELSERTMVAVGKHRRLLAEPYRTAVERLTDLVYASPPCVAWLLLCYDLVWRGQTCPTLLAPRTTWHHGVRLDWLRRREQAAHLVENWPALVRFPADAARATEVMANVAQWRHFASVLNANLFDVSVRVLATLAEGVPASEPPLIPPQPVGPPLSVQVVRQTVAMLPGAPLTEVNIRRARVRSAYVENGGNVAAAIEAMAREGMPMPRSTVYDHLKALDKADPTWRAGVLLSGSSGLPETRDTTGLHEKRRGNKGRK